MSKGEYRSIDTHCAFCARSFGDPEEVNFKFFDNRVRAHCSAMHGVAMTDPVELNALLVLEYK